MEQRNKIYLHRFPPNIQRVQFLKPRARTELLSLPLYDDGVTLSFRVTRKTSSGILQMARLHPTIMYNWMFEKQLFSGIIDAIQSLTNRTERNSWCLLRLLDFAMSFWPIIIFVICRRIVGSMLSLLWFLLRQINTLIISFYLSDPGCHHTFEVSIWFRAIPHSNCFQQNSIIINQLCRYSL